MNVKAHILDKNTSRKQNFSEEVIYLCHGHLNAWILNGTTSSINNKQRSKGAI